mgnify:CR=1 FL=1|tara:strand:- start:1581 stop:2135 length:555 start_codon:yes stop_codon:yes gene_type:complete
MMSKLNNLSILKETTLPDTFIESGSYLGDSIEWALQNGFDNIYSVDIDKKFIVHCYSRFCTESDSGKYKDKRINLYHNSSVDFFVRNEVIDVMKNQDCLYFLDAHIHSHKGRDTYTEEGQEFPILKELNIIKKHATKTSIIIVDDIDGFEQYGIDGNEIDNILHEINPEYIKYEQGGMWLYIPS